MRLAGKIGVITGATRGAGAGIAAALGAEGMTLYVVGRTRRGEPGVDGLPGTVEDAAEQVTARGGRGIPAAADLASEDDAAALFARVAEEHGRLDLLVSNAWRGYESYDFATFTLPFWQQPESRWEQMIDGGPRMMLRAARHAAPLLIAGRGLVVNTTAVAENWYTGALVYDLAKNMAARMALGLSRELRPRGADAIALGLGFLRTERTLPYLTSPAGAADLARSESPEYGGRAIAALLADPDRGRFGGKALRTGDLARIYGFTDVDGAQPPPFELAEQDATSSPAPSPASSAP